jgi:hypothetical protein
VPVIAGALATLCCGVMDAGGAGLTAGIAGGAAVTAVGLSAAGLAQAESAPAIPNESRKGKNLGALRVWLAES